MSLPPLHYFLVRAKKEQCVVGKTTSSSSPLPKSCLEFNFQFIPVHTDTNTQHFTPGVATLCHFITSCKCHDHLGLLQLKTNIKTRQGEQWNWAFPNGALLNLVSPSLFLTLDQSPQQKSVVLQSRTTWGSSIWVPRWRGQVSSPLQVSWQLFLFPILWGKAV